MNMYYNGGAIIDNKPPTMGTKKHTKPNISGKKDYLIAAAAFFFALTIAASGFLFFHPHQFDNLVIMYPATCEEAGTEIGICFCGKKQTRVLQALGHTEMTNTGYPATKTENGQHLILQLKQKSNSLRDCFFVTFLPFFVQLC